MQIKAVFVKYKEINEIEKLLKKAFFKFELHKHNLFYDSKAIKDNLRKFIASENYAVFKFINEKNELLGIAIVLIIKQVFNNEFLHLQDVAIQPNADLNKVTQAKIYIFMLNEIERFAKSINVKTIAITSTGNKYFIGKYLEKKQYKLTDKIYMKGV